MAIVDGNNFADPVINRMPPPFAEGNERSRFGVDIVNVRLARSLWLFDARDLNPRGLNSVPFFSAVKERYHFLGFPRTPEELSWTASNTKGIKFLDGAFSVEDSLRAVNVTLFNDGIIADTGSSTRHADAFLDDLLSFAAKYFSASPRADFVHKKQHISELIVRSDYDLSAACEKIGKLAAKLSAMSKDIDPPFFWFGFELRTDTKGGTPSIPIFKFEREVGAPPSLNRYFSSAGLQTEDHERLLKEFERIMAE